MKPITAIAITLIMLFASFAVVLNDEEDVDGAPSRILKRYFSGKILGLNTSNPEGFPSQYGLNVTGIYLGNGTKTPEFSAGINISSGNYSVMVDAEFHDPSQPWTFVLTDAYGWNESGGGTVNVPHPTNWSPTSTVNYTDDGLLWYRKGIFGNLSFTVLNGSSGEPLEGAGFNFERHPLHRSIVTNNYTDSSGNVRFNNLQVGLDPNNLVKVFVSRENFIYNMTGIGYFRLRPNATNHFTITMIENPLVAGFSPNPESNTDIPVENDLVPNRVFVQFHGSMDRTTIDQDTLFLREEGGEKVDITYDWPTQNLVKINPSDDLKYNTSYEVVVTPRVKNLTGVEPLWRTFRFNFTTELSPAVLRGTVYVNGTTDPAPDGTMIRLNANLPVLLVEGYFEFDNVLPTTGGHTLEVIGPTVGGQDEYLYYGNEITGITVERGQIIDMEGLVVNKRDVKTAVIEVLDEEGDPLVGADVTHQITMETKVTGVDGRVTFEDILVDRDTGFRVSLENYLDWPVTVPQGSEDPTIVNVTLFEKEFPLDIKARSDFTIELDLPVPVDSVIQIDFEDEDGFSLDMDTETMTADNLKILDSDDQGVPLDITSPPGDPSRWVLEPRDYLKYASEYTIFISEQVASAEGTNPLWRDFTTSFTTETLDPSYITGRVTARGKEVEGVTIEVLVDDRVIGTGESGPNGDYLVQVEHDEFTLRNVSVRADGSDLGLEPEVFGPIVLNAGGSRNFTDFDLERTDDWFQVLYPADDEGRMPVDATITLRFKKALMHSDMEEFSKNFTLKPPNIDLDINVSGDGKTVIIDPVDMLDYDKTFTLSVSDFYEGSFHRELMDVNGTPALIRGEQIEITTEYKPIEVILQSPSSTIIDNVPVGLTLSLFFTNYSVDPDRVESALVFEKASTGQPVGNLTFSWSENGKILEIDHDDLGSLTEYILSIPAGQYGAAPSEGARIRDDFTVYFTTESVDIVVDPIDNWPASIEEGGQMVITMTNDLGFSIIVAVLIEQERGASNFVEYANITLSPGETDRQVTLDTDDLPVGDYLVTVRVFRAGTPIVLINEYPLNIRVEERPDEGVDSIFWVFLVIGIIVVLVAILAVFLIMQSRKKDLDEELKEEFECPECHHLVSENDTVCPHCGAEFEEEAYKCPKCGSMLDPEDEECSECGYDFSDREKMELEEDEDEMELEDEEDVELDDEEEIEEMEEEEEG